MATISVRCQNDDGKEETYIFSNSWIKEGLSEKSIDFANFFAKTILAPGKDGISTSQFRNIYGELKRIQLKGLQSERTSFHLLLPKIAYAVKRNETNGGRKFNDLIKEAHKEVKVDEAGAESRFKNFCDLIEALLAYHKFYGGKN
jgi:CRISPR-associated protein Csm2